MATIKIFLPLIIVCSLASCSAEQVYNNAQGMEKSRCVNGPANDYQDCLERNSMSYEEYEAARQNADEDG